ncbi:MAG: glycosyltransferase family 87 protein [Syntrophobacteraceae bacterium]
MQLENNGRLKGKHMPKIAVGEQAQAPGWLDDQRVQVRLAVLIWCVPFLVITALVALNPAHRSVTVFYHQASTDWWAGKELYQGRHGFHYLPQFAVLFSPFHSLPVPLGDILWRFCAAALLATGVWRFQREQFGADIARAFLYASLFTVPLCLPALRNGQANGIFAALTLNAAACLPRRQWWTATMLIVLAVGIKLLGVVLLLLSVAVYAPLRWRLVPALAALALFPFLFSPADYVMAQYRACLAHMQQCSTFTEHSFADIGGIIRTFGWELPNGISKLVRVAAGGLALGLWRTGAPRLLEPFRAMWLLALSAGYLMLFNPMNEPNSYVILAPALGLWAVAALKAAPTRRFAWLTASISLSMALLPNLMRPMFGNNFALFWHPVMTFVFMAMLVVWVRRLDSPFVSFFSDRGLT